MALPTYRRVQILSLNDVTRMQEGIRASLRRIEIVDMLDGVRVENVEVGTGGLEIEHGLGRQPLGWFVVDQRSAGSVFRDAWDSKVISLRSSDAGTQISVWIF